MASIGLDETDIECYNAWLSSVSGSDEATFVDSWSSERDTLNNGYDESEYVGVEQTSAARDENTRQNRSPASSDSGNYSPTSSVADPFNTLDLRSPTEALIEHHDHIFAAAPPPSAVNEAPPARRPNEQYHVFTQQPHASLNCKPQQIFATATPLLGRKIDAVPTILSAQAFLVAPTYAVSTSTTNPVVTISCAPTSKATNEEDDYTKKLEDRRLRNRAAAQASRNRKRVQFDDIIKQMTECQDERDRLRAENSQLKERVEQLELQINVLDGDRPPPKKRAVKGVCLAMCVLAFTFYATSDRYSPFAAQKSPYLSAPNALRQRPELAYDSRLAARQNVRRHGRLLTALSDSRSARMKQDNASTHGGNKTTRFNERLRINSDIADWIGRHNKENNWLDFDYGANAIVLPKREARSNSVPKSPAASSTQLIKVTIEDRKNRRLLRRQMLERKLNARNEKQQVVAVEPPPAVEKLNDTYALSITRKSSEANLIDELTAAVGSHEDVLYMLTLKNYILMPMAKLNLTHSPKLSVVVPALTGAMGANESADGAVRLMRIDCEIVGMNDVVIPRTLASALNQTSTLEFGAN